MLICRCIKRLSVGGGRAASGESRDGVKWQCDGPPVVSVFVWSCMTRLDTNARRDWGGEEGGGPQWHEDRPMAVYVRVSGCVNRLAMGVETRSGWRRERWVAVLGG